RLPRSVTAGLKQLDVGAIGPQRTRCLRTGIALAGNSLQGMAEQAAPGRAEPGRQAGRIGRPELQAPLPAFEAGQIRPQLVGSKLRVHFLVSACLFKAGFSRPGGAPAAWPLTPA